MEQEFLGRVGGPSLESLKITSCLLIYPSPNTQGGQSHQSPACSTPRKRKGKKNPRKETLLFESLELKAWAELLVLVGTEHPLVVEG